MANNVQVILREDVSNLGKAGDLVAVRPGFARNFLLPRGLVAVASRGNVKQLEHEKAVALAKAAKQKHEAQGVAAALAEIQLEVLKPAGENDKLFGSVTTKEISEILVSKGFNVERRQIKLPDSLKSLGEFDVEVKLAPEITTSFKLFVKKQG